MALLCLCTYIAIGSWYYIGTYIGLGTPTYLHEKSRLQDINELI